MTTHTTCEHSMLWNYIANYLLDIVLDEYQIILIMTAELPAMNKSLHNSNLASFPGLLTFPFSPRSWKKSVSLGTRLTVTSVLPN